MLLTESSLQFGKSDPSKPRPNLFIIGAMKSGTTSLHTYLDSHPQIFMSALKEPNFLARDRSLDEAKEYLDLFASAGDALIIGESSTSYSGLPTVTGVPERIAQFNPEARFIYVMRDPVERTISHYWHMVTRHGENRDIITAFQEQPWYLGRSHYAMQLAEYYKVFPRARIITLTLEELSKDTPTVLKQLFQWLGVDPSFTAPIFAEQRHKSREQVFMRNNSILNNWRKTPYWQALKPLMPSSIVSLGKQYSGKYVERSSIAKDERAIEFLRSIQLEQVTALSEMLGRQFPEWTTLYATSSKPPVASA